MVARRPGAGCRRLVSRAVNHSTVLPVSNGDAADVPSVTLEEATRLRFVRRRLLRLAIAAVLGATVMLVAAVPVGAAQDTLDSGAWDLARYFTGGLAPPEIASPVLPLVVAGIVVLAAMSSWPPCRPPDVATTTAGERRSPATPQRSGGTPAPNGLSVVTPRHRPRPARRHSRSRRWMTIRHPRTWR